MRVDYKDLTNKLTEFDTINITADLSSCLWFSIDEIELTKKRDSLKVDIRVYQYDEPEIHEIIWISQKDTLWSFNTLLNENSYRIKDSLGTKFLHLTVKHKQDSLCFYTKGLTDLNKFIND